ncbi:hypothetical protein PCASD_07163 [Puccinia coronata f. sp. avenae]|uniref:Uncharacterized protein n=1 Tax=Puccinia coronata f. sp. avenae TaxID=200324 RepID=A0A2N5UUK3_9BASI|nr:hypothetical protein PCASD_07163 [Puccinia coronata f. sp. avenae]
MPVRSLVKRGGLTGARPALFDQLMLALCLTGDRTGLSDRLGRASVKPRQADHWSNIAVRAQLEPACSTSQCWH